MTTQELAVALVDHVEELDAHLVELTSYHAEELMDENLLGDGRYYLRYGSVWANGSYAVRPHTYADPGTLDHPSAGETRRLMAAMVRVAGNLTNEISARAVAAGRLESEVAALLGG